MLLLHDTQHPIARNKVLVTSLHGGLVRQIIIRKIVVTVTVFFVNL